MTGRVPATGQADLIIGLDVGTTAAKATAFRVGGSGEIVALAVAEYPLMQPRPGQQTQDPETVVAACQGALRRVVAEVGAERVLAIACSTAMHALVGLDADYRPLTPLITWADARATDQARNLILTGQARELHQRSGTPVHPMSPLVKLMWFADNESQLCRRVRWWVDLKGWLLCHLTGEVVMDLSSASGTGLLDLTTRDWWPATLDLAGVAPEQAPPVVSTTLVMSLAAAPARAVGLPTGLPVISGAGDGPLGNLGTGALEPGVGGLSLGTSGSLRTVVDEPDIDPDGRLFCYALTEDAWVVGGAISNGGIVARWTLNLLGIAEDEELAQLAARVPAGAEGLVMIPMLLAERGPLWDPTLRGSFLGVRHHHGRRHFARATMEGVALQHSAIADSLAEFGPLSSVRATGGVFRSPLWGTVLAGVLDLPLFVTSAAGGSALGAAALGALALDRAADLKSALLLMDPHAMDAREADMVQVDPQDVLTYRAMRADIEELLAEQSRIAKLFRRRE
ncbi:gluconokinase [Ammonicoccus fulvus]|uniref:Gluconokinase n=1 Tax=Ammonicoccus fulvus TaxID=3138240 RepID=A0ABZ3FN14_9ACTN